MSKTHRDLAQMEKAAVEVDGEYCVPQEEDEVRYHVDLGPILGDIQRPGSFSSAGSSCSSPRCSCSSSRSN